MLPSSSMASTWSSSPGSRARSARTVSSSAPETRREKKTIIG
jgi:hypothetical protein